MLKNYLTIALRSLKRRAGYTLIHVAGLGVGLACCLLIALFVREELSYDRFHENADRIVRVASDWGDFSVPSTNWPFVQALRADYPELEVATLLRYGGAVRRGEQHLREPEIFYADPTLFDVFSFALASGDPADALAEPYTAVLSEAAARKYFGDADPLGETLTLYGGVDVTVTGVLAPLGGSSHFNPEFVVSWETLGALGYLDQFGWGSNSVYTYVLLPDGMDAATLEAALPAIAERHAGENWNGAALTLQPLASIHLHSHHNMELEANGRASAVWLFGAVALFILLLACVNFMNLATARSVERAREVGVRKSVGAQRGQLARQFLTEALLLAGLALGVALALVALALPLFRTLADRALVVDAGAAVLAVLAALGLTLAVGLVAGSYPALVLSGFRPAEVLKGAFATSGRGVVLRKGLVVFQFAITVALLVGTFVVYGQLGFLRSASLGFDKARLVSVDLQEEPPDAFLAALARRPEVVAAAAASTSFPSELLDGDGLAFRDATEIDAFVGVRTVAVSPDFFDVLGVGFEAGRGFVPGSAPDSSAVVLNETAARLLLAKSEDRAAGDIADLIGTEVLVNAPLSRGGALVPILGVVEDFNMATLHEAVEPVRFILRPDRFDVALVRVGPGEATATVAALRSAWAEARPGALFEYRFTDAAFDAAYRAEERLGTLVTVFAGLAVFIACLGLLGLAAYAAQQRRKEIGVRKVLGASIGQIVALLTKDFAALVLVGFVAAVPLAWWAMDRWLDGFAYRVDLGAGVFVGAGLVALAVALAAVSVQALRAASTDPVQALRHD
ncbi:MAG: ABC transporter permease [Rhodothermales bacterium]